MFDNTLIKIANQNSSLFSVKTSGGEKVAVFENISKYVTDDKDKFCIAIINKITGFSFEHIFEEKFDFYASIFEYLIKDYNSISIDTEQDLETLVGLLTSESEKQPTNENKNN